jgi:phosphosulfolactate synthase
MNNPAFPSLAISKERSTEKPRRQGLTMVVDGLDSGWMSIEVAEQLFEVAGVYVDLIKIGWLTARFVDADYLRRKLDLYRRHDVISFTGGMLLEAAHLQGKSLLVIDDAASLGFDCMEISDSVAQLSVSAKLKLVDSVMKHGMKAIVEVGKKGHDVDLDPKEAIPVIKEFLAAGAYKVILESEQIESLFAGASEQIDLNALKEIVSAIGGEHLIFEVPYGKPVSDVLGYVWWFVENFGVDVNLANIEPRHALAVETVRHGYGFRGGLWASAAIDEERAG